MGNQSHIRDSRQPGHFWADNEIVDDYLPIIGAYGFAVYMLLCKYADAKTGQCDPSVGGMAKKLQISPPTVKKALSALEECGLISVKYRPRAAKDRKVNDTNIYTLLAVEKKTKGTQGDWVPKEIGYGVPKDVGEGTQGRWEGVPKDVGTNNTQLNNTHLTTPTPPVEKVEKVEQQNGADGGDEIAMLLDEYNIGAAAEIAQKYQKECPDVDAATIRQSIENLVVSGLPMGTIVNRLRRRPPDPGIPYQKSKVSPKAGERVAQTVGIARPPPAPADAVPAQEAAKRMLALRDQQRGVRPDDPS